MSPLRRSLGILAAFALVFGCVLAIAGSAFGAAPCWKKLINDWYDGRIDGVYPVACYRDAIQKAPEDIRSYSSLTDDLRNAMQKARLTQGHTVVPPGQPGRKGGTKAGTTSGGTTNTA